MESPQLDQDLADFVVATNSATRWDAARRLMASRRIMTLAEGKPFLEGFSALGRSSVEGSGLERLLAIDLLVRIPSYVRPLRKEAAIWLTRSLAEQPPGIWTITESKDLPREAKPAEVRENIVLSLQHASGEWVTPYVVEALAREDRSQRCRVELGRQLRTRNPSVGQWLSLLYRQPWPQILPEDETGPDHRLTRLRDIAAALADTIRGERASLLLSSADGRTLASLVRSVARIPPRTAPSSKSTAAAVDVVRLLDEMIAAEFTLGTEPDTYEVFEVLYHWWNPLPFPSDLAAEFSRIVRKLKSAITLRARMGQRSEALATRLAQALGPNQRVSVELESIAESEQGLAGDIDDWLRGRVRESSVTSRAASALLGGASSADFERSFAPLLLDCHEATYTSPSDASTSLRRIIGLVDAIALSLKLSVTGEVGELVEYRPSVHRTIDDRPPPNPLVRIVRPMVVRQRQDGSQDIVERALVVSAV
jgi:hypothetical protein